MNRRKDKISFFTHTEIFNIYIIYIKSIEKNIKYAHIVPRTSSA